MSAAPFPDSSAVVAARSLLFVPATRPERFAKALASGADAVVLDLEDAVPAEQKDAARATLVTQCAALASEDLARVLVRINAAGTPWHEADLAALVAPCAQGLGGVMVAKAESAAGLAAVAARLGPRAALVALVESLAGLDAVDHIAHAPPNFGFNPTSRRKATAACGYWLLSYKSEP